MGTVYAKDIGQSANKNASSHSERASHHSRGRKDDDDDDDIPTLNFQAKARVDKIHIDGLMRTKEDFVVDSVKDLFKAKDFQEVLVGAHKVRGKLESLGCFRHIGIFIDTSHGPDSTPYGYEVTFYVHELNRMMGGAKTLVGNNEGSVVLGLRLPNMFGRGEKLATEYSYGSKRTSGFNFSFVKPLKGSFSPVLTATMLQSLSEWPWSGYKQIDRGILLDYMFSMPDLAGVKHNLQWEGTWCEVMCLSKTTAFPVREEAGHTVKSSVRHIMSVDTRDTPIFPTSGFLLRLRNEFAGLGGNVGFLKHDFAFETNWNILPQVVLQGTLQGGLMTQMNKNLKIGICDRFFLGGPPSLRGFRTRGVGPHVDNCALGGNAFWGAGFHIFTPLPFNPGKGGLGELFRTHLFVNSGALNGVETTELSEIWQKLREDIRTSYGIGIALRLGQMARLELNYCLPLSHKRCDQLESGFQFGFGIQFI